MIDHTTCSHDRTSRDRAECRRSRADLVDRLAGLTPHERNLIEVVLDMAEADTVDAPARDLLVEGSAVAATRARQHGDADNAVHPVARRGSIATVGDLLDHLSAYRRDRPLMLVTSADGAGWLERVRDDSTGSVDLLAFDAEVAS